MRELPGAMLWLMFHILDKDTDYTDACICQDSSKSILKICAYHLTSK